MRWRSSIGSENSINPSEVVLVDLENEHTIHQNWRKPNLNQKKKNEGVCHVSEWFSATLEWGGLFSQSGILAH